jgi:hypothetical protein
VSKKGWRRRLHGLRIRRAVHRKGTIRHVNGDQAGDFRRFLLVFGLHVEELSKNPEQDLKNE